MATLTGWRLRLSRIGKVLASGGYSLIAKEPNVEVIDLDEWVLVWETATERRYEKRGRA